jgi:hypothetical protein
VKTGRGVRQGCCLSPILFNLYGQYLTNKALEGFEDCKVILTVKYADYLALEAEDRKVLQGKTRRLIDIGKCYEMKMNARTIVI